MGIKKWAVEHYGTDAQKQAYRCAKVDVIADALGSVLFYAGAGLNVWCAFTNQDTTYIALNGILAGVLASSGARSVTALVKDARRMSKIGSECVDKMKEEQGIEDA